MIDLKPKKTIIRKMSAYDLEVHPKELYNIVDDIINTKHSDRNPKFTKNIAYIISEGIFDYKLSHAYADIPSVSIVLEYSLIPGQYPEEEAPAR